MDYRADRHRTRAPINRVTIDGHGLWTAELARSDAGRLIAGIKGGDAPSRAGSDAPAVEGLSLAKLAEQYMHGHVAVH